MVIKNWMMIIAFLAVPLTAREIGARYLSRGELNRLGSFIKIPGGTYQVGQVGPVGIVPTHKPLSHISLPEFYIMDAAVTQEFYARVMGVNPSRHARALHCPESFSEIKMQQSTLGLCPQHPVEKVSFYDAQVFVERLNKMDVTHTYSLPTEDQLEVAFRASSKGQHFGENSEGGLGAFIWHKDNSRKQTEPVLSKRANTFGIYRSSVWEWTLSYYIGNHRNDKLSRKNEIYWLQIIKGGAFDSEASRAASSFRAFGERDTRYDNLGFRVVRTMSAKRR